MLYCPWGQLGQNPAPAALNFPGAQGVHSDAPAALNFPGEHASHEAGAAANVPAGQEVAV